MMNILMSLFEKLMLTMSYFSKIKLMIIMIIIFSSFISINIYLENFFIFEVASSFRKSKPQKMDNFSGPIRKEGLNLVNFNPMKGEGSMGKGVIISLGETSIMQRLFNIHNYNLLASDRISLNRTLPDMRMASCQSIKYSRDLPITSVIIIFHNEAWSVLLRTIWSIITRTPPHLLKEIILIDDASEREHLKDQLREYIKAIPISIIIIRTLERKGIEIARLIGAKAARGKVLTFIDSHCECSKGWAEPLLARINENSHSIISPVIDVIDKNNFSYIKNDENAFFLVNWNLEIIKGWHDDVSDRPIQTPIMAGSLFSIDRNFFFKMLIYNELMLCDVDNIEMSFRIWQCGGQVEIHPCSHVGHLTYLTSQFPSKIEYNITKYNRARIAIVWMDEWAYFYLQYNTINIKNMYEENGALLIRRHVLQVNLNCKPFFWYLKNPWLDNFFPAEDRFFGKIVWLYNGTTDLIELYKKCIKDIKTKIVPIWSVVIQKLINFTYKFTKFVTYETTKNFCIRSDLNTIKKDTEDHLVILGDCVSDKTLTDNFVITINGLIMTNDYYCLSIDLFSNTGNVFNVIFKKCYTSDRNYWKYEIDTQRISLNGSDLCLTVENNQYKRNLVIAKRCSRNIDFNQKWALIPLSWQLVK